MRNWMLGGQRCRQPSGRGWNLRRGTGLACWGHQGERQVLPRRCGGIFSEKRKTMQAINLDGLTLREATRLIQEAFKASAAEVPAAPLPMPEADELPERNWGFCQSCDYTIGNCQCEDGPY